MSEETALRIFSVNRDSVSSKRWRMARRGMLGNGSRIVHAVAIVSGGSLTVESRGVGLQLGLDVDGHAIATDRFSSQIASGTRVTLTVGPKLPWDGESSEIYIQNALIAEGVAYVGEKASAAYFDRSTLVELIRDVAPDTTVMKFAGQFDLSSGELADIRQLAARQTTRQLLTDPTVLDSVVAIILGSARELRPLRRIGKGHISGQYGTATGMFELGEVSLPYVVEVWATGFPVESSKSNGAIEFKGIFLNRTPSLELYQAGGYVGSSGLASVTVGNERLIVNTINKPCSFEVVVALTAPDFPLTSLGKAIDIAPFRRRITEALGIAFKKAYRKPDRTQAELRAEERATSEVRRAIERYDRQRERRAKEADQQKRRAAKIAATARDKGHLATVVQAELAAGMPVGNLTVMSSVDRDPYRIGEKAANHRIGKWLAEAMHGIASIHLRGLHYRRLLGLAKPDGSIYGDDAKEDWRWLVNVAAKAARWLGYVGFERLFDQRSDPPTIAVPEQHSDATVAPTFTVGKGEATRYADPPPPDVDVQIKESATFPRARNPYRLMLFGEKSGLREALQPLADEFHCDTYFPAGEISDSHLHKMAADANADGRELVLLALSDCDPSGWQMAVSISHKLRALRDLHFPEFRFRVVPVALTPEQGLEFGLPQTRLNQNDKRSERWLAAFGVQQIEFDALIELQPDALRRVVREAVRGFFDDTLARRQEEAEGAWWEETNEQRVHAREILASDPEVRRLLAEATQKHQAAVAALQTYRETSAALDRGLEAAAETIKIDWPEDFERAEPQPDECAQWQSLVHSGMTFREHCAALKARKAYYSNDVDNGHDEADD